MRPFEAIFADAAARKGDAATLDRMLAETQSRDADAIAVTPDDRLLSAMTRRIFYAGFSSKVIDAKWDAFEDAFGNFALHPCAFLTDEQFDALMRNGAIVRNGAKLRTVADNARFLLDLAAAHGGAARFFAEWPDTDYVGLLDVLKKRGNRLGGETGMRFLRALGKPAFIPTADVAAALIREGVLEKAPSSKRDFAAMQAAFNTWADESGRDLTAISRTLAMSVASDGYRGRR